MTNHVTVVAVHTHTHGCAAKQTIWEQGGSKEHKCK